MRLRKLFGWFLLLFLSILPLFFWAGSQEAGAFTGYNNLTHSLGEIFGLVGMTMFALTFILSTRLPFIEDLFGGLDKVYLVHGVLGGSALLVILLHPIFLVLKFIPDNWHQAALYLLPSSYWSVNFGIIALLGLILLISLTLFSKMKYHRWKFTHEFLGLVFIFAVLHAFLVRGEASGDLIFPGYYIYVSAVSIVGLGAFSYSLFFKNRLVKNAIYTIFSIKERKGVFSLILVPQHKPLAYKAGQFVYLRFYNERLSREAHPFSIASSPKSGYLRIIIKALGDFTNRLRVLKIGDKVALEGPYGRFDWRRAKHKDQVWFAAGIGITPFIGMLPEILTEKERGVVDLFYTVREPDNFLNWNEFRNAESETFRFHPWVSQKQGRLNLSKIEKLIAPLQEKEFFLCGSEGFKESLTKALVARGVKKRNIHEEAFGFL